MTFMATTTRVPTPVNGARRADMPEAVALRQARRVHLAAACYAGILVMVALTIAASRVLSPAVGLPVFVVGMVAIVAVGHPGIGFARRKR